MAMNLSSTATINESAGRVWDVLDDYTGVDKFSPGTKTSELVGELPTGLGAKRKNTFYNNGSVVEEIIEYNDGKSFTVDLTESSMPLKSMNATFLVEPMSDKSCKATIAMEFVPKGGPLGTLLGTLLLKPAMKGLQKKMLSGLAYLSVSGELVGDKLPSADELAKTIQW